MRKLSGLILSLVAVCLVGCGDLSDAVLQNLADPTGQLPPHVNWGSYNLYRYQSGAPGRWIKIVSLGQMQMATPIGLKPVMMLHGLGSSIRNERLSPLAQNLIDNGLASDIFGFEYDTQDSIAFNGTQLTRALNLLNPGANPPTWSFVVHGMGGLVTRSAVQSFTLPMAASGNRVISLATPHQGSPVADAVQTTSDAPTRLAVINRLSQDGFTNADGNPCQVSVLSQGFSDLRASSSFLQNLNDNVNNHAQVNYFTLAGNVKGSQYQSINDLLKVSTDDGFVTIDSANFISLGALGSRIVASNHTDITQDATNTFPAVRAFLVQ